MKYRGLVFDFFGVICAEVAPPWLPRYFTPAQAAELRATLFVAADRGDIPQEELFERLARLANITPERVAAEWQSYVKIDDDLVALISSLRGRTRLGLLTNSPAPFVRDIIARYALSPLFDDLIVSAETGMAKPEPAIFRAMLAKLALAPSDAVMIDDNEANIAAAKAIGMQTFLYVSCGELRRALMS